MEDRTGRPGRRDRVGDHRRPPASRHVEVEPDRTPPVQPHLDELARTAADLPSSDHRDDRLRHHQDRPEGPGRPRHRTYPRGVRITDKDMKAFEAEHLQRHQFHGDWNYTITAQPASNPTRPENAT